MEEKKKRKIFVAVFSVLCCLAIGAIATIWSTVGSGQKQEVEPGEITPITFEEVQDEDGLKGNIYINYHTKRLYALSGFL